ncbi:MAG TPA: hypothetical protein VMI13_11530 [Solirubrobacteraceae bacterium]|nr:hypothetical protein [Solirubrobacteraceae bacterium]
MNLSPAPRTTSPILTPGPAYNRRRDADAGHRTRSGVGADAIVSAYVNEIAREPRRHTAPDGRGRRRRSAVK